MGNGRGVVVDIHGRCEKDFWGGLNIEELSFECNPFVLVCLDC